MSGSLTLPDPTIPLRAGADVQPVANPLAQAGRFVSLGNDMLALQSGRQQMAARQAIGPIYQAAIGPDGQLDTNKLLAAASANPATAWMAGDIAQQALARQGQQVDIAGKLQTQHGTALDYFANKVGTLLQNPNTTKQDALGALGQSVTDGVMPISQAQQIAGSLPDDPGQLRTSLVNFALNTENARQSYAAKFGQPGTLNTGGQVLGTNTSLLGGVKVTGPLAQMTPSPESLLPYGNTSQAERATVVPVPQKDGSTAYPTKGAIIDAQIRAAQSSAGGGFGSGRYNLPPGLSGPGGGASSAQPTAPSTGGLPALGSTPSIAETEGMKGAADAGVDAYKAANASVAGSPQRIYALQAALSGLAGAPTGPGTDAVHYINGVISAQAPALAAAYGADPAQLANYDLANKYLTSYASQQASKFGGTTDSQLATALSANASTHIQNLAATEVVKANLGLERMGQDLVNNFQAGIDPQTGQPMAQPPGPQAFADYASKWASNTDARAYVAPYLDPAKFSAMVSGMSPADLSKFQSTFNRGIASGAIQKPAWATPAPAPTPAPITQPDAPATPPVPNGN